MPPRFTTDLIGSCTGTPPLGCRYCDRGAKLVLYITGVCKQECFYCPLSETKKGRDVIYANERLVEGKDWLHHIISEAKRMRALGTGITGGDPLVVPTRTALVIKTLKEEFGKNHHVHLYTTGPFDREYLGILKEAGLDEIRFHPPILTWSSFRDLPQNTGGRDASMALPFHQLISEAKELIPAVGLEIPAVIDEKGSDQVYSDGLLTLVKYAVRMGLDFVNINELEASHSNMELFAEKGYDLVGDSMAVAGSRELAWSVIKKVSEENPGSSTVLHFCSSVYKDSVQLRHRLKRMASNLRKPYDVVTDDGTFVRGVIISEDPEELILRLENEYEVPKELMEPLVDRILIAAWVLEEIGPDFHEETYISEVYPTWDGLEVERIPI